MKLIKKVLSCGLSLSVALSGVYAQLTKAKSAWQNLGNISQNTKKAIIGCSSAVGGAGVLGGLFFLAKYLCTRSSAPDPALVDNQSVLIVGGTEESRQKITRMFKGELEADVHTGPKSRTPFIKKFSEIMVKWKHPLSDNNEVNKILRTRSINWQVEDCDVDAEEINVLERLNGKTLVIAILDSDEMFKQLQPLFDGYNRLRYGFLLHIVIDENYVIDASGNTFASCFENSVENEYERRQLNPFRGDIVFKKYSALIQGCIGASRFLWNSPGTSDGENFYLI